MTLNQLQALILHRRCCHHRPQFNLHTLKVKPMIKAEAIPPNALAYF